MPDPTTSLTRPRHRLLYIGHDLNLLKSLKEHLKSEDWFVVRCPGGSPARNFVESEIHYDLLIFDDKLPSPDGLKLVEMARALKHRVKTPILLLLSGNSTLEARLETGKARRCFHNRKRLYLVRKQSVVRLINRLINSAEK